MDKNGRNSRTVNSRQIYIRCFLLRIMWIRRSLVSSNAILYINHPIASTSTCSEYFIYLIDCCCARINKTKYYFKCLVTQRNVLFHINKTNKHNKYLFGVFYLFNWILLGMDKSNHTLFQVVVTHRHVLCHINIPIDSLITWLEYFIYFIDY